MIYLIGYMGAGKTTLASKLSKQLQLPFLDTDFEIEKKAKKSISDIFKDEGELHFRMLENELLNQIKNNIIVSCGGGIPMHNDNMLRINKKGISIYLKASAKNLASRLKNEKKYRPLIANIPDEKLEDYIKEDLQNRSSYYNLSHHTVSINNKTEDKLLREIYALIRTL